MSHRLRSHNRSHDMGESCFPTRWILPSLPLYRHHHGWLRQRLCHRFGHSHVRIASPLSTPRCSNPRQLSITAGLRPFSECPIHLVSGLSLNITLGLFLVIRSLFLHPLYRSSYRLTARLRRLARRTLVAAAVALITSAVNMVVLTVMHGQQLGWVCLGSCGTDVTINALALYFVTGSVDEAASQIPHDHVASPPSKRQSGTALRKAKTAQSPEEAPDVSSVSNKGILSNDMAACIVAPQRTVHFPGAARTTGSDISEYEMTDKLDAIDPTQTAPGFLMSKTGSRAMRGVQESKHQARDSYLGVNGVIGKSERSIFIASKLIVRIGGKKTHQISEKRYLEITAAVHDSEMPRCTTPEGEPTEVYIRTEGLSPPRPNARSQSRGDARNRPTSSSSKRSQSDLEAQTEAPASATFVSKVVAKFRSNNSNEKDAPLPTTSMIVNVKTLTEEHTDSSQQFDASQPRWKTLRGQGGEAFVETGL